jgi:hypothetical protein
MKRIALFAFVLIGLAACDTPISAPTPQASRLAGPSLSAAQHEEQESGTILNQRIPFANTVFNPCPPAEPVFFQGIMHTVTTGEVSATSIDTTTHINAQGFQGVGLITGARYEVPANERIDLEFSFSPVTIDETFEIKERLIRQGSLDNFWLRVTFRLTFPPFRFEIISSEVECRG